MNGGLMRFGYPISEEFPERLADGQVYTVQYFERTRFERHPERPASPISLPNDSGQYFYHRSILATQNATAICRPDDLAVSLRDNGAGGTAYIAITLRNRSDASCTLAGFLGLELLNARGQAAPGSYDYSAGFGSHTLATPPLIIQPGQAAESFLTWPHVCPGNPPIFDPDPATALRIALPNGEGHWTLPVHGPYCGRTGDPKRIAVFALGFKREGIPAFAADLTATTYLNDLAYRKHQEAFALLAPALQARYGSPARFAASDAAFQPIDYGVTGMIPVNDRLIRVFVRFTTRQIDGTARSYSGSYDITTDASAKEVLYGQIVDISIVEEFP